MRVYQIGAASDGKSIVLGTTDTALEALKKYLLAVDEFGGAWVIDCTGAQVNPADLIARAAEETRAS